MESKLKKIIDKRINYLTNILNDIVIDNSIALSAKFILDNNIWVVDNICYLFRDNIFIKINDAGDKYGDKLKSFIQEFYSSLKNGVRNVILNEVCSLLENKSICPSLPNNKNVIFLLNGCFDIFSGKFKLIDNDIINQIPLMIMNFNFIETKTKYNDIFVRLLKWWTRNNENNYKFLKQMLGAIFSGYQVEKIFNFYGVEGSGKSLLIQLIERVVGPEFVANTNITSLVNRFGTLQILRKKLLVETDIQDTDEIEPSMLKKISGGDTIQFEFKGGGFLYKKPQTNILISSNNILQFKGTFQGINRRLLIYYFPYSSKNFDKKKVNGEFDSIPINELNKIREFINGEWLFKNEILEPFVSDCLKEFHRLYLNNFEFIETQEMKDKKRESETKSNSILFYYDDKFSLEDFDKDNRKQIYYIKGSMLFDEYADWAKESGYKTRGKNKFFHDLKEIIEKHKNTKCYINKNISNLGRNFVIEFDTTEKALNFLENGEQDEDIEI